MTTDLTALIAHHAAAATEPRALPSPAPSVELDTRRRDAQRRFDASPVWARDKAVAA